MYASSSAVYNASDPSPAPETGGTSPSTLYGVSKLADEGIARVYRADAGVSSIGLRPYVVYGVGRDQGMTSGPTAAMLAAARGEPSHIGFSGVAQYDYAPDVARAAVMAAHSSAGRSRRLQHAGRRRRRRRRRRRDPRSACRRPRSPGAATRCRSRPSWRRSGSTATSARSRARRSPTGVAATIERFRRL